MTVTQEIFFLFCVCGWGGGCVVGFLCHFHIFPFSNYEAYRYKPFISYFSVM